MQVTQTPKQILAMAEAQIVFWKGQAATARKALKATAAKKKPAKKAVKKAAKKTARKLAAGGAQKLRARRGVKLAAGGASAKKAAKAKTTAHAPWRYGHTPSSRANGAVRP